MAERSSSDEWQRAARGSPSDTAPPPAKDHVSPDCSGNTTRPPSAVRPSFAARRGVAITTSHFTLYARPASTKKQVLRLAFGARAGHAAVRNRAKRQAREAHRAYRHKLPETGEIVITTRGRRIDALGRRATRDELMELFTRAAASASRPRGGMAGMR